MAKAQRTVRELESRGGVVQAESSQQGGDREGGSISQSHQSVRLQSSSGAVQSSQQPSRSSNGNGVTSGAASGSPCEAGSESVILPDVQSHSMRAWDSGGASVPRMVGRREQQFDVGANNGIAVTAETRIDWVKAGSCRDLNSSMSNGAARVHNGVGEGALVVDDFLGSQRSSKLPPDTKGLGTVRESSIEEFDSSGSWLERREHKLPWQ
jgi:hypothetical protein